MFGLFGQKKPGGGSLLADGSFAFFGCLSLLFVLMAAPLLALVIVSREGLAELAHNVAAAFAGDRLWILAVVIVAGAVVRYAIAGPLVDWLKAREMASQEQIHYPPPPAIEIHNSRGVGGPEIERFLELLAQANKPTISTISQNPPAPTLGSVPFRQIGQGRVLPGKGGGIARRD
jgi:hypothetical protein